jgi:hypothetical protein
VLYEFVQRRVFSLGEGKREGSGVVPEQLPKRGVEHLFKLRKS